MKLNPKQLAASAALLGVLACAAALAATLTLDAPCLHRLPALLPRRWPSRCPR